MGHHKVGPYGTSYEWPINGFTKWVTGVITSLIGPFFCLASLGATPNAVDQPTETSREDHHRATA